MPQRVLILGGGVGGIVTAAVLRGLLPAEHEVTLVEKRRSFNIGAAKTWVMLGQRSVEEVTRPLERLARRGVRVVEAEVQAIDPARREVRTTAGTLAADHLVIALGADLDLGAVPGLAGAAETFYTLEGAVRLREVLKGFAGGEVLILNPRMPIKCPPAPYEAAMLLDHDFTARGIRGKSPIAIYTVEPAPTPTAGSDASRMIREELEKRRIGYHPLKKAKRVDGARRVVEFEDGGEARYDLLVAVPPHEAPKVVRDAGLLGPGGWIPVDPRTLRTSFDRVFAIGDVTSIPLPGRYKPDVPLVLPKAAVFAEAHAKVVAANIAAAILGTEARDAFDGKGMCFIEVGGQHAMGGEGSFFEPDRPRVSPGAPDLDTHTRKLEWAEGFLKKYL